MTKTTNIILTNTPVSEGWQADNPVQIFKNEIHICLKDGQELSLRDIQKAGRKIEGLGIDTAKLTGDLWTEQSQWAFAMGFTCVGKLTNVEFTGDKAGQLADKLAIFAWSRDLTNQTPSQLYPLKLAELAAEYIKTLAPEHVSVGIISGEDLEQQGWTGIYNVGKGSINPPCLMILDYNPTGDSQAPVAASLVGKGITFDSGGYSIKPSAGMFDMKCDMGGAAVVAGALALAIKQGLDKRVKLFLCCAENMVSSHAYKLGDILTYKNGLTVEVANTDAEGRLVLADGLLAAAEANSGLIIDAATLTGAAMMATGGDYTALFGLDADLMEQTKAEAVKANEPVWQLPLERWHQDKCSSVFADTANSRTQKGGGAGGASNAAGFLARFVANEGKGWLHMDLAAAYNGSANSLWAAGGTGQGIATIAALICDKA
ncbi:aminopeptidase PepB [Thalassomonas actiniarum]|uniref:Aminopeptidase PepB n=1 Tax=Thalassomonas actiniarum TaxID=485447 RepID=A0AAF0C288_9GAMM|nr:aminopeptidase PepB [Thalassomonas actiniarum]WDD98227.1 aminopeptidase PepB [Thalassomonas actiniarum]